MKNGLKVLLLTGILVLAGSAWPPTQAAGAQTAVQRSDYHRGGDGYHYPRAYHRPYAGYHTYGHGYYRPYPYRVYYPRPYRYRPYAHPYYYYPPPPPVPYYPGW